MPKTPTATRRPTATAKRRTRSPTIPQKVPTFVVYVRYPTSYKEYAYLCDFPAKQGDTVLGNSDTKVEVIRTAAVTADDRAFKYVRPLPDMVESAKRERRSKILLELKQIETEVELLNRFSKLSRHDPRARRLLAEYKKNAPSTPEV